MSMEHVHEYVKTVKAIAPAIPSSTAFTATEVVATGGYDRIQFVISTGAIAATSTLSCKVQNSVTSGGTLADVASAALAALDSGDAGKIFVIDVPVSNTRPYYKLAGTAGVSTVALSAVANLYKGTKTGPPDSSFATQLVTV